MTTNQAQVDTIGQENGLSVNDAHFAPVIIPEQTEPVSVKSPSDDSENGPFKLRCNQCECEFESDNGFDKICDPCNAENYEEGRDVADYIFDNH